MVQTRSACYRLCSDAFLVACLAGCANRIQDRPLRQPPIASPERLGRHLRRVVRLQPLIGRRSQSARTPV